jgi:hypothetical protein
MDLLGAEARHTRMPKGYALRDAKNGRPANRRSYGLAS